MDNETKLKIEERIVEMLKTVYDPEIPVNVYDLGLIYRIDLQDDRALTLDMTLTAPQLPCGRLYHGGYPPEGGVGGGSDFCSGKSCLRAGMGQGHDDRRS